MRFSKETNIQSSWMTNITKEWTKTMFLFIKIHHFSFFEISRIEHFISYLIVEDQDAVYCYVEPKIFSKNDILMLR